MKRDGAADIDGRFAVDERSVILRLRKGDRSGLGELVDRYGEELMQYLVHMMGDRDAAEDVFQDTWVRVVRSARRFDPDRPFAPWLFRIARNRALDLLRRGGRWKMFGFDTGEPEVVLREDPAPDASEMVATRDTADKLMARLDPLYREVIALRFYGDHSYQEIAEICKVPIGTVKSRINRAMDALAELYARMEASDA